MQGLATEMPKMLEEKLANKRIDAETKVLKEADQARYFFQKYQVFQEERQAKKMRNPAYRLKKKITPEMDMSDSSDEDDNEN